MSAALDFLNLQGDMLVMQVVERQCAAPGAPWSTSPKARLRCLEDNRFHLHYLAASIQAGNPEIFSNYCGWVKIVLGKRGIAAFHLKENLEHWKAVLLASAPEAAADVIIGYLDVALKHLPEYPNEVSTIAPSEHLKPQLSQYMERILALDSSGAMELLESMVTDAASVFDLYVHVLQPAQREIGRLWQVNSISVAVEHYATATAQQILHRLSRMVPPRTRRDARIIGICGEGEHHCVGLEMVCSLCQLDGWDTYFVGANTPTASALELARQLQPEIIAVSMTTLISLQSTRMLIAKLKETLPDTNIVTGGYAATLGADLWKSFGADAYASDAISAVSAMERILEYRKADQHK
ncbi:MAG TPA: cobalamin-dependent protein [Candidatus Angelobacter sp.]|nr:cobalamin-dependent protein [Candidatus Angelobacter sp.]